MKPLRALPILLVLIAACGPSGGTSQDSNTAGPVSLPPQWTATPEPTASPIPSETPISRAVRLVRPSEEQVAKIVSLWNFYNLADGLDLQEPGSREFAVEGSTDTPMIWPYFWCARGEQVLAENLEVMSVEFAVDGVNVPADHILEYEREAGGWNCHYWATLLSDWQPGSQISLNLTYRFARAIHDGEVGYPAGEYTYRVRVTVTAQQSSSSMSAPDSYVGPNLIFYLENAGRLSEFGAGATLMTVHPDGSGSEEIAQGFAFTVSPDVSKVAFRHGVSIGKPDEVRVVDLADGKLIAQATIPGFCDGFWVLSGFDWSPDNQRIAYSLAQYGLDGFENACAQPGALQQRQEDAGVYQLDVTDGSVRHFQMGITYDAPIYKREGSVVYLPVSEIALDAGTGDYLPAESAFGEEFCPGEVRVAQCGGEIPYYGPNLCLVDKAGEQVAHLTDYGHYEDASPDPHEEVVTSEGIQSFSVSPDCSTIVYSTDRKVYLPLTPDPQEERSDFSHPLHVMDVDGSNDDVIMEDVIEYVLTPDGGKIVVIFQRQPFGPREIAVLNADGTGMHSIDVPFPSSMLVSPTGEEIAIAGEAIYVVETDGHDLKKIAQGRGLELLVWR